MAAVHVDDRLGDPDHVQSREMGENPLRPDAEGESVQALVAGDERVGLLADEMHEAVACTHLERLVAFALTLPREARAAQDEEDFLVALAVQRRRALARVDTDSVHPDPLRARRRREVGPVAADRAGLAVLAGEI